MAQAEQGLELTPAETREYSREVSDRDEVDIQKDIAEEQRAESDVESQSTQQVSRAISWARGMNIAIKTVGVIAFILSCIALWPAIASALDTKRATSLAQWTSAKDFLDYCESHQSKSADCLKAYETALTPPPGYPTVSVRFVGPENETEALDCPTHPQCRDGRMIVGLSVIYPLLFVLAVLRRLGCGKTWHGLKAALKSRLRLGHEGAQTRISEQQQHQYQRQRHSADPARPEPARPSPKTRGTASSGTVTGVRSRGSVARRRRRRAMLQGMRSSTTGSHFPPRETDDTSDEETYSETVPCYSRRLRLGTVRRRV